MSKLRERQPVSVKFEELRYISNLLSLFRIILVPPIVYFIIIKSVRIALVIAIVAMLSDSFDGYLARKLNQTSDLGRIIDPVADKLLIGGIFISLLISQRQYMPPIWAIMFIIFRDVLVLIGNSYLVLHTKTIISSGVLSKWATVFTCVTIGTYILAEYLGFLQIPFLSLAIIFSAISAVGYLREMLSILREKSEDFRKSKKNA